MPKDKRIDLLLQLFLCQLMIIPHPKVFLNGIIFSRGNINRMIPAVAQALRNQISIALICFDSLSLRGKHGCGGKNNTFDPGIDELVI